jgi:L-fuconolactonase
MVCELSKDWSIIRGIVGWTDLASPNVDANIKRLQSLSNGKLVGIRHLVQIEPEGWLLRPEIQRGLKVLEEKNLSFDIDAFDSSSTMSNLKLIPTLAEQFPNLTIVLDHLGRHHSNKANLVKDEWFAGIRKASEYDNVFCKL